MRQASHRCARQTGHTGQNLTAAHPINADQWDYPHKSRELQEVNWQESETFRFDAYMADIRVEFHDLRNGCIREVLGSEELPRIANLA